MLARRPLGRIIRPLPANVPSLARHAIAAAPAPVRLIRDHIDFRPQMFGNDKLGDCTCAAVGNAALAQAALAGYQLDIRDQDAIDLYVEACGYVPGNPATDQGAVETDVLAYQAARGIGTGGPTRLEGLWANIEAGNLPLLRTAMARLGYGYLGVRLAMADQAGGVGGIWDTNTPVAYGDPTPGSWGGHALGIWDFDGVDGSSIVRLVTWGGLQRATWRWLVSRMDEAHMLVHPQIMTPAGIAAAGVDAVSLAAEIRAMEA